MQDAASEVQLRDEEGGIRSDFLHKYLGLPEQWPYVIDTPGKGNRTPAGKLIQQAGHVSPIIIADAHETGTRILRMQGVECGQQDVVSLDMGHDISHTDEQEVAGIRQGTGHPGKRVGRNAVGNHRDHLLQQRK